MEVASGLQVRTRLFAASSSRWAMFGAIVGRFRTNGEHDKRA
jgi:hypothetical protein